MRDVPNLSFTFGYTNASWTLKADLMSEYVCRILKHMDATGSRQCTPRNHDPSVEETPFMDLQSGYLQRAASRLPRQGSKAPWRLAQNYAVDSAALRFGRLTTGSWSSAVQRRRPSASQPRGSGTSETSQDSNTRTSEEDAPTALGAGTPIECSLPLFISTQVL